MNATVRQLLETQKVLRARKAQENAEKGKSQVPSPYVFPSPRTEKRLVEIKYSFVRAVKQAKITDLRFHDLRHTAATRMGDAGADAFTLAAIFGWSDIRMAMRYTHAMEDAKRRAVEAIAHSVIEVRDGQQAGEDACGPRTSDLVSMNDRVSNNALGENAGVHRSVKDDEECSYQILRD